MWTIGRLAQHFSLSRSTLLYYDRVGLLSPSGRSSSNYRLYSDEDYARLQRITSLREAGLPLESINHVLQEGKPGVLEATLEKRLQQLNQEIQSLRSQQQTIVQLLKRKDARRQTRTMDKQHWVSLLEGAGMDDAAKIRWHTLFETTAPEAHQDFLESLGIDQEEIKQIRQWSQQGTTNSTSK